ncbi:MAG: tRNA (adenosine(37)-N6)-threonylcarbamoyltransferase complex transferase subunit TsaD [Bacilli bacterium]
MKDVYILGIETSCDETSCSIVKNGFEEINTVILSQVDIHTLYGGVVPEIASRNHIKDIVFVIDKCLKDSNLSMDDISAIAVTNGPGLVGSLLVGLESAKTLSYIYNKPLVPVHHIRSHIYANNIEKKMEFPLMALIVSGGHTNLLYMKDHFDYEVVGETLDDAVGECYDKVGRVINVPYPGGPEIDKLAHIGNPSYSLPIPLNDDSFNFSFSGLKSAVINLVHNLDQKGEKLIKEDLACSFQNVVVEVLTTKTIKAMKKYHVNNLIIAGGVSANKGIRHEFEKLAKENNFNFSCPNMKYCTDNATMVAAAGYFLYKEGKQTKNLEINADSGAKFE